jgi:serine/threonine protein phosphatase PrpC
MQANGAIYDWGFMPGTNRPLGGCAGTVAWLHEHLLFVFHAGDTVALLIRDGKSLQLTRIHETNGAIYRYFGLGPQLKIDVDHSPLEDGDRILLLSDGVTKVYHPDETAGVIQEYDDPLRAVSELCGRSRSRGSTDDITVLLIEIED